MTEPRFYVVGITGYGIPSGNIATSYSVIDSAQAHREVYVAYAFGGAGNGKRARLARCEREAARRNALDAAGCPA